MLISIIAERPSNMPSIARPEDELALELITEALQKTSGPEHQVLMASSLQNIVDHLKQRKPGPSDHVQIIGHGTPGMLALGYFWTGTYANQADTFALDSDLSNYGVLDGLVSPDASVSLIGCAVGEDRVGLTQCDGPTLIFDLARLWSCSVSASVGPVGVDDFDETGRFLEYSPTTNESRMVTARGRSVTSVAPPTTPSSDLTTPSSDLTTKLPKVVAVERMHILGPRATPAGIQKASEDLVAMEGIPVRQIPYRPLLGMPEIVAKLEDGTRATFFSNASIIQVPDPKNEGRYVHYAPVTVPEVQRTVRQAVRSAL